MSGAVLQIQALEAAQLRELPDFRPGDQVEVHYRIREGEKERIQVFKGIVIRRKGGGNRETFTVRKVSYGVGVERIFPVHSPKIERLELVSRGHVRRAKLYYLRALRGKKARLRQSQKASGDLRALKAQNEPTNQPKKRRRGKRRKQAAREAS